MLPPRRLLILSAIVVLAAGSYVASIGPSSATTPSAGGGYVAVRPTRLLDTRSGVGAPTGAVPAQTSIVLQVAGRTAVPAAADISAVVLTVTVVSPSSVGNVRVYAADQDMPSSSNLNFVRGQTVPNLVVSAVSADGRVSLFNDSYGTVQLIADVSGYYLAGQPSAQGAFGPTDPRRLLDTRLGTGAAKGAVAGLHSVAFTVTGNDVPTDVSAVVLNVTAVSPTAVGWVSAYADGGVLPSASNLNLLRGQTVANLVLAPVGSGGKVRLYNGSPTGSVQLVADVFGYFSAGDPVVSGGLGALAPARLLDTRAGTGAPKAAVGAKKSIAVTVAGRGGVPLTHVSAVVLNITAVDPKAIGFVSAYADGDSLPTVSNLNLVRGVTVPDLAVVPVGSDGKVRLYNGSAGTVQLLADVSGYVLDTDVTVPGTSISRYVRNLSETDTTTTGPNYQTMEAEGQADAASGSKLVLLDIGAQRNDATGVALSAIGTLLTYTQLQVALDGYLEGFRPVSGATVVVSTNNGADDWTHYTAAERGADWANVINQLSPSAGTGVTVKGGDDIESGFFSTELQAQQWETAYLKATPANLIFNGSADGCPSTYGATGSCDAAWTQKQYYALSHSGSRITVLPQVYVPEQAVQWANIDVAGGGGLVFAGSLTEYAACPSVSTPDCTLASLPPVQGWAALYHALSTVVASPSLPAVTDLRVDD